jgi:hypothetical protein
MTAKIDIPTIPRDAAALLDDPRLADLAYQGPNWPIARRMLPPAVAPVPGESPYLLFSTPVDDDEDRPALPVNWVNSPMESLAWGKGSGFPDLEERPRFEEGGPTPSLQLQVLEYGAWLIAAPEVVQILQRFAPESIETAPIEVVYEDGGKIDSYVFLDVRRLIDAYDYRRCEVLVAGYERGLRIDGLGAQRGLRAEVDKKQHIFRDAFQRDDIFVSRALARALLAAGVRHIRFDDPADMSSAAIDT